MRWIGVLVMMIGLSSPLISQTKLPPAASMKVDYLKDVRPLMQNCFSCHGPDVQQSGLRLDLRQNALRGGDYGPVITPGDSANSRLIRRLVDGDGGLQMPPTGALSDEDIGILRAWIDQGAEFRNDVVEEAPPKPMDPKLASFIAAIRSGDRRTVEKLVVSEPEIVEAQDLAKSTPLHHAAGYGTLDIMKLLLDKGADINAKNKRNSTPLHWAIHDEAKVRLLITRGADINAKQIEGRSPLYQAATLANGAPVVRLLLEKGADPNVSTLIGMTPLMAAATRGDIDVMRMLTDKGANVNARNGAGETPLMNAATIGDPQAVQFLLGKGADATVKSKRSETALGNASTAGVEETVKLLLDHGASVNLRNIRGYSPLMLAAGSDAMPAGVVRLLLAAGADTSYSADYDETAAILAAKRGDSEVARLLGAPVSPQMSGRETIPAHAPGAPMSVSNAVTKAAGLMEKQSYNFIRTAGCNSCHSQDLSSAASGFARSRGLTVPTIPQLPASMMPSAERLMDLDFVNVNSVCWQLFDLGMNHAPKNEYTDAIVRFIKAMQLPEGRWLITEGRRPPMNAGDFQTSALAIYSLKQYGQPADKASTDAVIAKAVTWLENAKPVGTQDRAFHLLGLTWGSGNPAVIKEAARAIAALQRADGGWNQLPGLESDAYATGEVLYALNASGKVPISDAVYQNGIAYLTRTQAADGSWHVVTRSIWLQPYFESGFPYGRDQFISTAGTAWATMALVPAAESRKTSESRSKGNK